MPSRSEDPPSSPSAASGKKRRRFPKGGPTKAELKKFREALLVLRTEILKSSSKLADEALKGSGQDFSVDHMADHGTDNFEQDFSLSLLEGETELFRDIQHAIDKIDGREELPVRTLRELRRRAAAGGPTRAAAEAAPGSPRGGSRPFRTPGSASSSRSSRRKAGRERRRRPWRLKVLALTVLVVGLALDLGTKAWFADLLGMDSGVQGPFGEIDLIPGFFALQGTYNPGVTFGLAPGQTGPILLFTGVATLGLLAWLLFTRRASRMLHVALGMILGGCPREPLGPLALGARSATSSCVYTGDLAEPSFKWPNFNVADAFIVVGVCLILLDELVLAPRKERAAAIGGTRAKD